MPSKPFLIADTGETLIWGEWVPDPAEEAAKLLQLANALGDWTEPMVAARAAIIHDTEQHFATETDPQGEPWAELNEDYHTYKLWDGYPDEILVRTGELKDMATSESAYLIDEREILFDSSVLPFYGPYHQGGAPDRMGGGPNHNLPNPLPKREFVGISEACENEIEAIFVEWINRTTDVVYPPTVGSVTTASYGKRAGTLGIVTNVAAYGGGVSLRGAGGRFVGAVRL